MQDKMLKAKYTVVAHGCNWAIRNSLTGEFLYRINKTGEYGNKERIENALKNNQRLRYDMALFGCYNKMDAVRICEQINSNKIKLL